MATPLISRSLLPPQLSSSPSPPPSLSPSSSRSSLVSGNDDLIGADGSSSSSGKVSLVAVVLEQPCADERERERERDLGLSLFVGKGMLSAVFGATIGPAGSVEGVEDAIKGFLGGARSQGRGRGFLILVAHVSGGRDEEQALLTGCRSLAEQYGRERRSKAGPDRDAAMGVDVDVVSISDSVDTAQNGRGGRSRAGAVSGPGFALTSKIAGAVADMGYDFQQVRKVAHLVSKNVGSVSMTHSCTRDEHGQQQQGEDIRDKLALLLKPSLEGDRKPWLHVNSDEPVLLFHTWGGHSHVEVEGLMSQIIGQLQQDYGIKPVRAYAREGRPHPRGSGKGFSISVLNVVNTEIGGPSMIQLLDQPTAAFGWRTSVAKEEWEGSDWSAGQIIELAMKSWNGTIDLGRVLDKAHTDKEAEEVWEADIRSKNADIDGTVLALQEQQQPLLPVRTHESASSGDHDLNVGDEEVEYQARQGPEINAGSKALEKNSQNPVALKLDETRSCSQERGNVEKLGTESSETRRTAPTDGEAEEGERIMANIGAEVGVEPELKGSAEEDFEIVDQPDRHQSLIDMVLGQGMRK